MKKIKLYFDNFWPEFNYQNNIFTWALSQSYDVIIDKDSPDLLITTNHLLEDKKSKLIFYQSEPWFLTSDGTLDRSKFSHAISTFNFNDPFLKRVPLCLWYHYEYFSHGLIDDYEYFLNHTPEIKNIPNDFCSFVSRNPTYPRKEFFDLLSQYKFVTASGSLCNNSPLVPGNIGTLSGSVEKTKYLSNFKFNICFDNSEGCIKSFSNSTLISKSGIFTEKLYEAMLANTIPIYWGNADISNDINTKCIINVHDYDNLNDVVDKVIEIDSDDNLYFDYINQKYVEDTKDNIFSKEYIVELMKILVET